MAISVTGFFNCSVTKMYVWSLFFCVPFWLQKRNSFKARKAYFMLITWELIFII